MLRKCLISGLFGGVLLLALLLMLPMAVGAQSPDARARVLHGSPDAPPVDVWIDGAPAFENLAFSEITGYAALPPGPHDIQVVPAGETEPAVISTTVTVTAETDYTIMATEVLTAITPVVLEDDNTAPAPGQAHVRAVHVSPNAPAVDIAVAGGPVLFGDLAFPEASDYLPVEPGTYDIEVRLAGTSDVVLTIPDVEFEAGTVYSAFAVGLAGGDPALSVLLTVDSGPARLRAIHASPDAPPVDVWVDGAVAFENLAFGEASSYATLHSGQHLVELVVTGTTEPVVISATVTLEVNADYSAVAIDELASLSLLLLTDDNSAPDMGDAKVRFIHASPDAPAVDVRVQQGPVLFSNVAFGETTDYVSVSAGVYDLEVTPAMTDTVVLSLPDVDLAEETVYTVVALGLAAGDPPLQALLLADAGQARARVVHASPDAPAVDVWVDGELTLQGVTFTDISDYLSVASGDHQVQVVPAGETEPAVISETVTVEPNTDYTIVASDVLTNITPLVLVDDNTRPDAGMARVRFVHLVPDAPAVDVAVADGGPILFGDIAFQEVGDYISVAAGVYDLEVRVAGTDTVVLDVPGVELEPGAVYTVYAMGLVEGPPSLQAVISLDLEPEYQLLLPLVYRNAMS